MDKATRLSKVKARVSHAQEVLKKAEKVLGDAEKARDDRFGNVEMEKSAKLAAEGLNLASLDELRSMKMQPPPVVEIVARCVCTLASGDDLGDAEYRAKEKAREAAAKKAAAIAISKGLPPPKPRETVRRRLLSWEESQRVLARSNFKEKIANFDGRLLLDNDDIVAEVRSRIDLSTIKPEQTMAQNLKPPVRTQRERNEDQTAMRERRETFAEAIAAGNAAAAPLVTIEDARYVSKIAPPLLVWLARILVQHEGNEPAWKQVTAQVRDAQKKVKEAMDQLEVMKKKADEAREEDAKKRQRMKEEKERAEALGLHVAEEEEKKKSEQNKDKPTELTHPDMIVITGPRPNIFFQNGRISSMQVMKGQCISPRLQLPMRIHFFIRVKHYRVSFPFPPSISTEKYLLSSQVIEGHEEAGPVAQVAFDPAHVIGLHEHHLLSLMQLVIEVPSTDTVNPTLHPARMAFHPRHGSQMHSFGKGGAGTVELPRLIVPVYPHLIQKHEYEASIAPKAVAESPDPKKADSPAKGGKSPSPAKSSAKKDPKKDAKKQEEKQQATPAKPGLVPPLAMDLVRSIGSAYRWTAKENKKGYEKGTSASAASAKGKQNDGFGDANWARAAIALTERARKRPFGLSLPGPTRQIPDVLLQSAAVDITSAKRLSRSSARLGVEAVKELSALVLRTCEGYVLTKAERRQLVKAAALEQEVITADAKEAPGGEEATAESNESATALAIKAAEEAAEKKAKAEAEEAEKKMAELEVAEAKAKADREARASAAVALGVPGVEAEPEVVEDAPPAPPILQTPEPKAKEETSAHSPLLTKELDQLATVAAEAATTGDPAAAAATSAAFADAVQSAVESKAEVPTGAAPTPTKSPSAKRPASPRGSKTKSPGAKPASPRGNKPKGDAASSKSAKASAPADKPPSPAASRKDKSPAAAKPPPAAKPLAEAAAPSSKSVPPLSIPAVPTESAPVAIEADAVPVS